MKQGQQIFHLFVFIIIASCTGSRKYFKAAERLEKQGLVNEAAAYYYESLQRKPTNVEARIKLKDVGQKCVSNMASDFFRNYNTNQLEASLESFERLKSFSEKTSALNVVLDYPKQYEEDYQKVIETYISKNYDQAYSLVNQRKYTDALNFISRIKKYNGSYKNTPQLEITATCEPLYQQAVSMLENKNYPAAYHLLNTIKAKTENYKDSKVLLELASSAQTKYFILFAPKNSENPQEKIIEDNLYNNFNQIASQKFEFAKVINNTPFTFIPELTGGNSNDVDLIQGIRKATGADYFYTYDIYGKNESNPGPQKSYRRAYQEVKIKKNDTLIITEYRPVDYAEVKSTRSYSYMFNYKIINAQNSQIVASQNLQIMAQDAVNYNEFSKPYNGNINNLYPYNPDLTPPIGRYSPAAWRKQFSANTQMKTFDQLRAEADNRCVEFFTNSVTGYVK